LKVLFIFLDVDSYHFDEYNFGLAYLSGLLKNNNYDVKYCYVSSQDQFKEVLAEVMNYAPDIIGFTSVESQFIYVKKLSKIIRDKFKGIMICGGVYVTLFPWATKEADSLDGIIIGEGEYALLRFLENIKNRSDYRQSSNFCYYDKGQDRVVRNELLPLIQNLDELPFPDREMFDHRAYLKKRHSLQFLFNRGCPYQCTYCSNKALGEVYGMKSNMTRYRSVDNCLEEIEDVLSAYSTNKPLYFVDDLFTFSRKWLFEFLEKYKKNFHKPFICHTRSNLVNDELFANLKNAGCFRVMMSIESGNDFIRNEVMKRGITQHQLLDSFQLARNYGIETNGVAMIGLPFETKEMAWDTIKIIAKAKATSFTLNIFYPYKGTELHEICKKNGFLPQGEYETRERRESILNLPTLTKEEILFFYHNCERLVMNYRPIHERMRFYAKKFLGIALKKAGLLDTLRNSRLFIKIRKAIYS